MNVSHITNLLANNLKSTINIKHLDETDRSLVLDMIRFIEGARAIANTKQIELRSPSGKESAQLR